MSRLRYSMLQVTINTNRAAVSAYQETQFMNELEVFFRTVLSMTSTWRDHNLIDITPSFDAVSTITLDAIGFERQPKYHKIHAHFTVTIAHRGKVSWRSPNAQRNWQDLVNRNLSFTNGSYVHVRGANSRSLNYISKEATRVYSDGVQDAIVF